MDKILENNLRSISELNADISVGSVEVGERQQELLDINRGTLSDLLVLLREFRNEADPEVYGEAIDRITARLAGFRASINQATTEEVSFIDLLIPGASTYDPVGALEGLFSDAEREFFRRAKEYTRKIGSIRGFITPIDSPLDLLGVPFEDDLPEFDSSGLVRILREQINQVEDANRLTDACCY